MPCFVCVLPHVESKSTKLTWRFVCKNSIHKSLLFRVVYLFFFLFLLFMLLSGKMIIIGMNRREKRNGEWERQRTSEQAIRQHSNVAWKYRTARKSTLNFGGCEITKNWHAHRSLSLLLLSSPLPSLSWIFTPDLLNWMQWKIIAHYYQNIKNWVPNRIGPPSLTENHCQEYCNAQHIRVRNWPGNDIKKIVTKD